jgi:hypothetical protein
MQNAVKRGLFLAEVRTVYGLDANDGNLPVMNSEAQYNLLGRQGNSRRSMPAWRWPVSSAPITFPVYSPR